MSGTYPLFRKSGTTSFKNNPLSSSSSSSNNNGEEEQQHHQISDEVSLQLNIYTLPPNIIYRVQHFLLEYSSPTQPTTNLLKEHTVGSSGIIYVINSSSERSGYERLVSAVEVLKTKRGVGSGYVNKRECHIVMMVRESENGGSDSERESMVEKHNRSVMDDEISAFCKENGIVFMEYPPVGNDGGGNGENNDDDGESSPDLLATVFSKVVSSINIASRNSVFRDPAFLLGKNVNVGEGLTFDEEFLTSLFNSPS